MVLWGWWVGVGRSWFVRQGLGLVGGGWSVVVSKDQLVVVLYLHGVLPGKS